MNSHIGNGLDAVERSNEWLAKKAPIVEWLYAVSSPDMLSRYDGQCRKAAIWLLLVVHLPYFFAAWLGWLLSRCAHLFSRWLGRIDLNSLIVAKFCDGTKARAAHTNPHTYTYKCTRTQAPSQAGAFMLVAMFLAQEFSILARYHIAAASLSHKRHGVKRAFLRAAQCRVQCQLAFWITPLKQPRLHMHMNFKICLAFCRFDTHTTLPMQPSLLVCQNVELSKYHKMLELPSKCMRC